MSSQNPFGSTVPPERPANPTHFGGEGLYESKPDTAETWDDGNGSAENASPDEHVNSAAQESRAGGPIGERSFWDFAKRNHLVTFVAVGGIVWMLRVLLRRSMGRG
jgi:hypothetical protein